MEGLPQNQTGNAQSALQMPIEIPDDEPALGDISRPSTGQRDQSQSVGQHTSLNHNNQENTRIGSAQKPTEIEDDEPTTADTVLLGTPSECTPEQREGSQSSSVSTTPAAETPTPQTEQTARPRHEASGSPRAPSRCKGTPRKLLTPSQVDAKIADILQKPLTKLQLNTAGELGNNYVFEVIPMSDPSKQVVKIGVTKESEQCRLKKIKSHCQHILVEDQQDDPEHVPIPFYYKAEKLIHAELYNFLYVFDCNCGDGSKSHNEYFDVDRAIAQEITQRWRRFCRLQPYGADGRLTPFWDHRLRNRNRRVAFESEESIYDHDKRRQRWERFANPRRIEMVVYDVVTPLIKMWPWRWQVVTILQSFYIAYLVYPPVASVAWIVILLLSFFAEILKLETPVMGPAIWRWIESVFKEHVL
ncbi:hypothetical protein DL764_009259 [Monosporascus ibericus]|uniref:Bacteriophage T5 Orf172 DNA-binding domain-containing protein n=1 Tax=Monosporascus ibericus TaxID=155417 RepID=A0A4Q4SY74_9PEZI|nr:hypothetical protein DL764_009259 [Monosporascus ibericus]